MSENTPIERMKKILALARRGVDGEKVTAEAMLAKLLAKYKMTIEDLEGEVHPTARYKFTFKTKMEARLLVQIVASVLNTNSVNYWKHGQKKLRSFELTALQHAEVDVRYTAYRVALQKELDKAADRLYQAFIQANHLGVRSERDDGEPPNIDMDELQAIMALMATMKPTPIHRQLENAA